MATKKKVDPVQQLKAMFVVLVLLFISLLPMVGLLRAKLVYMDAKLSRMLEIYEAEMKMMDKMENGWEGSFQPNNNKPNSAYDVPFYTAPETSDQPFKPKLPDTHDPIVKKHPWQ